MNRADKKRKVAPHVPTTVKSLVHEVGVYLHASDGEAGAQLIMSALGDYDTLQGVQPYLLRAYAFQGSIFPGYRDHARLDDAISPIGANLERLSMRFEFDDWATIDALGFALGRAVSHAAALLLHLIYADPRVTQIIAPGFHSRSEYALQEASAWASSTRPSVSRV